MMKSNKHLRLRRLPVLILTLAAVFLSPFAASAQLSDQEKIEANVRLLEQYRDWFFDSNGIGKSSADDFYDKKNLSKGIVPYLEFWKDELCLYNRNDVSSQSVCDETWSGEKVSDMNAGWLDACKKAANLITGTDGKGFLPLAQELLNDSKADNVNDDLRKKIQKLSSSVLEEARKAITTDSCVNALANIHMVFDDNDYHCSAEKALYPTKVVKNTSGIVMKREDQFTKGSCKETSYSSYKWKRVPSCSASSCEADVKIDPDASDYYQWNGSSSKGWKTYYGLAKKALDKFYQERKELGLQKEANEKNLAAKASATLKKGSVVGLSLPLSDISIPELIGRVINRILSIVGALGLAGFIYGGILYMTAAGSTDRADKGRKAIVWSTLGLVVIFAAYAIVNFVIEAIRKGG